MGNILGSRGGSNYKRTEQSCIGSSSQNQDYHDGYQLKSTTLRHSFEGLSFEDLDNNILVPSSSTDTRTQRRTLQYNDSDIIVPSSSSTDTQRLAMKCNYSDETVPSRSTDTQRLALQCNYDDITAPSSPTDTKRLALQCNYNDRIVSSSSSDTLRHALQCNYNNSTTPSLSIGDGRSENVSSNAVTVPQISEVEVGSCLSIFCNKTMQWAKNIVVNKTESGRRVEVSVVSEDCEERTYSDFTGEKWRVLKNLNPRPSMVEDFLKECDCFENAIHEAFAMVNSETARRSNSTFPPISPEDFLSLRPNQWITDAVIDSFSKTLLRSVQNTVDDRIFYVSPVLMELYKEGNETEALQQACDDLRLHDIDVIVWPFHHRGHWCLSIGVVSGMKVLLVDPYTPYNCSRSTYITSQLQNVITQAYNQMWDPYFQNFSVPENARWCSTEDTSAIEGYNFPSQPMNNGVDCGVCVCMYIWAVMTGEHINEDLVPNAIPDRNKFFAYFRGTIGNIILHQ